MTGVQTCALPILASNTTYTVTVKLTNSSGDSGTATTSFTTERAMYGSVSGRTKTISKMYGSVGGETKRIVKFYGAVETKNLSPVSYYDADENRVTSFRVTLPVNTYTISFDLDSFTLGANNSFNINMQLRYADDSVYDPTIIGVNSSSTLGRKSYTFTTTKVVDADASQASNIRIAQTSYDKGARAVLSNIQIEQGSTPTTYIPHIATKRIF